MLGRAERVIEGTRNWTAIVAVAGALLREKTLYGSEVEALVKAAQQNDVRPG
jgi:hypothetical protein